MFAQTTPATEAPRVVPLERRRIGWRLRIAYVIADHVHPDRVPHAFTQLPAPTRARYLRLAECVIGYLTEELRDGH